MRQPRHLGPELVGHSAPLRMGGGRVLLGVGGADPGGDDAPLGLARVGERVAAEMHDPNAIRVVRLVISVPFAGAGLSTKRRRRDALFP